METYGYYKVACATPALSIGNVAANVKELQRIIKQADPDIKLIVFPELCLCGYTCGDLFYQSFLLDQVLQGLTLLCNENKSDAILVVGCPIAMGNHLFNCAVYLHHHDILGIVPKTYLPNYNEFYEQRWFSSANARLQDHILLMGKQIPFTPNLILHDVTSSAMIATDICEDLWVPIPPSTLHCLHGANVIVNLSASNETIGKSGYRRMMIQNQSAKCICGYLYASAGKTESSSDLVFSGHNIIMDNGYLIKESTFHANKELIIGEIDLEKIKLDRIRFSTYMEYQDTNSDHLMITCHTAPATHPISLVRTITPYPFVPDHHNDRIHRCHDILNLQATGLSQRLKKLQCNRVVLGISGGLDSTLALIVAKKAFMMNHEDTSGIITVTMPGYGTTKRTHDNSKALMNIFSTTAMEIDIHKACEQHYQDIKHDPSLLDVTYENVQARERTQILMDLANKHNAIVVGTGDMSELALGWCTYNGDQMSMYAINASIPKTLVRYLVASYSEELRNHQDIRTADILDDICDTPVSPELLPPSKNGSILQITEQSIGSYDYHDFFLYHMIRNGYGPKKIYMLAQLAFKEHRKEDIKATMRTFYCRFFQQQFKRNCMPDTIKVGSVCLSPRGDWRMPSDASVAMWLKEVETL